MDGGTRDATRSAKTSDPSRLGPAPNGFELLDPGGDAAEGLGHVGACRGCPRPVGVDSGCEREGVEIARLDRGQARVAQLLEGRTLPRSQTASTSEHASPAQGESLTRRSWHGDIEQLPGPGANGGSSPASTLGR